MKKLEEILGYHFKDKNLLRQALTHSSCTRDVTKNYERLEFLGDRVLGVSMAALLYKMFPDEPEGNLSPRFTRLVRTETVAEIALELQLDKFIHAETEELCHNENVLCDVAEAIIGAVCIEAGFEKAIEFVGQHWRHLINLNSEPQKDNKTNLQEISHHLKAGNPVYEVVDKVGSDHEPQFSIKVTIEGYGSAVGNGKNKKIAEQNAAAHLLTLLKKDEKISSQLSSSYHD